MGPQMQRSYRNIDRIVCTLDVVEKLSLQKENIRTLPYNNLREAPAIQWCRVQGRS